MDEGLRGRRAQVVNDLPRSGGVPSATLAVLMLAVFTVSVGYGVLLPLLPSLIAQLLGEGTEIARVSRHTGLLTAVYTFALFLFAAVWGRLSDRHGRRSVMIVGLLGLGFNMLAFLFVDSFAALYAERFLSGMFASAVTPVAAAAIGDFATSDQGRARRLAFVSMSGGAGFLLGPMLGVFISRHSAALLGIAKPAGSLAMPFMATALLAFLVGLAAVFAIPGGPGIDRSGEAATLPVDRTAWVVPKMLALTFIVSVGIGTFEVGLALGGTRGLALSPYQIALMFGECSLVMFVVQAIVFSPWVEPDMTRRIIMPALAVLAAALFLVPWASDFTSMLAGVGAVAASAGILSPVLTYWISKKAGNAQGWELGKQTAAASLGITIGSAAGGVLFNSAALPGAPFVLAAALVGMGMLLSLGLAGRLVRHE